MPQREELILDVTAKLDQAQSDVAALQGQLDELQAGAEVDVAAAVEGGEDVDTLATTVEELDGTQAEVDVAADAEEATQAVGEVTDAIEEIDGATAEVEVEADADDAIDAVEEIAEVTDDLDGTTAEVEVEADTGGAADDMEDVADALGSVESAGAGAALSLGSVVTKLGPVAAAAGALGVAAAGAYDFVGAVEELALFSGAAYEDSSRLLAVLQDFTGIEVGKLENTVGRMTDKFAEMPELAEQLGINVESASDPLDLFVQTVDALNSGQLSATERIRIGMDIFGRGGLRAVNEIAASLEGPLADAIAEVSETRIITDADIAAADKMEKALGDLKGQLASITQDIGGPLLEIFTPLINLVGQAASLIPTITDPLTDLISGERSRIGEVSQEFADFVQLLASGKEEAEAWQLAFGDTEGLERFRGQVQDVNEFIANGIPLGEAMAEVFGLEGNAALAVAEATGILADETDVAAVATAEATAATDEYNRKLAEAGRTIADVASQVPDLGGALAEALDVGDIAVDLQTAEANIRGSLDTLFTDIQAFIDEHGAVDWSVVLDPAKSAQGFDTDLAAMITEIRDTFQEGIVNAFESGGAPAAQAFLTEFLPQLLAQGMTPAQAYELLGLPADGSVAALIEPIVDQQKADQARAILDALAFTDDPLVAQIRVGLETGAISGDVAYIASLLAAQSLGIAVDLSDIPPEDLAAAQAYLDAHPVTITAESNADDIAQGFDSAAEDRETDVEGRSNADDVGGDLDDAAADRDTTIQADLVQQIIQGLILSAFLDQVARIRIVQYLAKSDNLGGLNALLNGVARNRTSNVHVTSDNAGAVNDILNFVARDRYADIIVRRVGASGGGGTGGAVPQLASLSATSDGVSVASGAVATLAAAPATVNVNVRAGMIGSHLDADRFIARSVRNGIRLAGRRQVLTTAGRSQ